MFARSHHVLLGVLVMAMSVSCAATKNGGSAFRVEPLPPAEGPAIPWLSANDDSWQKGQPTFELQDKATPLAAKGWLATTDQELLLRVDVTDAVHFNPHSGGDIWNGDFLRISLDGRGDGTQGAAADVAGVFGPDDQSVGFALTPSGAEGWCFRAGDPKMEGAYPAEMLTFTRDEAAKLTRYIVRIPWSRLGLAPGTFPQLGLCVQVRNVDSANQREPVQIRWGQGADEPRPGLFQRVTLANPPHQLFGLAVTQMEAWEKGDSVQAVVAIVSRKSVKVTAVAEYASGGPVFTETIPGSDGPAVRRWVVHYNPSAGGAAGEITVMLTPEGAGPAVVISSGRFVVADAVVDILIRQLDWLIMHAPGAPGGNHPLWVRHLRSVKAMVQTEWAKATIYKRTNPALARETLKIVESLYHGFQGPAGRWESYTKGGLPLFLSYISPRDGTLQWYTLTLPRDWDPKQSTEERKAYPLFFELHGAGNPHYLNTAAAFLGAGERGPGLLGYAQPGTFAQQQRLGYHVMPFGRGNTGYRDIGETDVWEAYDDARRTVRIDPDRQYLYGFSMGGSGTWLLGSRTPDRWAAIAILGMGAAVGDWGQGQNVAHLPIYIWGGEADAIAFRGNRTPKAQIEAFAKAIGDAGGEVHAGSTPGVGHNYLPEKQEESVTWLATHVRHRPDKFSFVSDTDQHTGAWGIRMTRDLAMSGLPRFDCAIDGQTVAITSTGTPGLTVDPGPNGLGLSGQVTITWNGKSAYEGPAATDKPVVLGKAPGGGRR